MSLEFYCHWGFTVKYNNIFKKYLKSLGYCRSSSYDFGVLRSPYHQILESSLCKKIAVAAICFILFRKS